MTEQLEQFDLVVGGRPVRRAWDNLLRYCGLPWSGEAPETWAYRYYDLVETEPDLVGPVDVLAAAALHPGLSRADLTYFSDHAERLSNWVASLPRDVRLRDSSDDVIGQMAELTAWEDAPSVALLSKVLHRKRPELIPLVDRHVLDWYRPITGERSAAGAWRPLLEALRADLDGENAVLLAIMKVELDKMLRRGPSHLRMLDITIWMTSRR